MSKDIWYKEESVNFSDCNVSLFRYIKTQPRLQISKVIKPKDVNEILISEVGSSDDTSDLREDIFELVNMFCYLFDLKKVVFGLKVLDHAMCPRFHVNRVTCRLITTYQGIATEWLPHHLVDRSKLGYAYLLGYN